MTAKARKSRQGSERHQNVETVGSMDTRSVSVTVQFMILAKTVQPLAPGKRMMERSDHKTFSTYLIQHKVHNLCIYILNLYASIYFVSTLSHQSSSALKRPLLCSRRRRRRRRRRCCVVVVVVAVVV